MLILITLWTCMESPFQYQHTYNVHFIRLYEGSSRMKGIKTRTYNKLSTCIESPCPYIIHSLEYLAYNTSRILMLSILKVFYLLKKVLRIHIPKIKYVKGVLNTSYICNACNKKISANFLFHLFVCFGNVKYLFLRRILRIH